MQSEFIQFITKICTLCAIFFHFSPKPLETLLLQRSRKLASLLQSVYCSTTDTWEQEAD